MDIDDAATDGIQYNFLNLPATLKVKNSGVLIGTIEYVYDATGNKQGKIAHETGKSFRRRTPVLCLVVTTIF